MMANHVLLGVQNLVVVKDQYVLEKEIQMVAELLQTFVAHLPKANPFFP